MAVTYGFFNSLNHDRVYNADQMSYYFKGLVSDGVYESIGSAMQVTAGGGMNVQVGTGRALINTKWVENDAIMTIPIAAAHVTLGRYTAIVIELSIPDRLIEIKAIDGTPASSPKKPTITKESSTIWQLCLAYVYVPPGATAIAQANIEDKRGSADCQFVTGLIDQVDTSYLFDQWQDAFETYYTQMRARFDTWFESLTESLNINTYIQQYRKDASISQTNVIPLDMELYAYSEEDIILVFINGLLGIGSVDYTLSVVDGIAYITTATEAVGTAVSILALKSRIGFSTLGTSTGQAVATSGGQQISI